MYFFLSWEDELMFGHIILKLEISDIWPPPPSLLPRLRGSQGPHGVLLDERPLSVPSPEAQHSATAGRDGASTALGEWGPQLLCR